MTRWVLIMLGVFGLCVVLALFVIGQPEEHTVTPAELDGAPSCNGCDARHQRLKKKNLTQP